MNPSDRALLKLTNTGAVLALERKGGKYGVFAGGDRRRRPLARLSAADVSALHSEGAIESAGQHVFTLSSAGRARISRQTAAPSEAYLAQHAPVEAGVVASIDGGLRSVRRVVGYDLSRRLAQLRDAQGGAWFDVAELRVAETLRRDWAAAQAGIVRGSDWSAAPMGAAARGPANAQERALAARCDANRRLYTALDALAAPLRRAVERVCLHEDGLEALERSELWPPRSAKLALKLGLAQLVLAYGLGERGASVRLDAVHHREQAV